MVDGKPIRILSVEDRPVFREELRTVIESQPDMLPVAQAAAGAVAEFRRHRPDVTLMDLRLSSTLGGRRRDPAIAAGGSFWLYPEEHAEKRIAPP